MNSKKLLREFVSKILSEQLSNSNEDTDSIGNLNDILKGYLEAALWTEEERLKEEAQSEEYADSYDDGLEDDEDTELDKLMTAQNNLSHKPFVSFIVDDLEDDSKIQAYLDIKTFINLAGGEAIAEALEEKGAFQLGMDIWLTRNRHGAGFFDHNYDHEQELMNAGKNLKEVDMYLADSGQIVFSNAGR